MNVLLSGGSGLVGTALTRELERLAHSVLHLRRAGKKKNPALAEIKWDVESGKIDEAALERCGWAEAVVHLAGESLSESRWTRAQKEKIYSSRVQATERLVDQLLVLKKRPQILVSASAIGVYGSRGDELLTEESSFGSGFLPRVVADWERASERFSEAGGRVVRLRFAMILSGEGGALRKMKPFFGLGLGGPSGSGRQWVSWVSRGDVIRAIIWSMENPASGAYNVAAPNPVRNREFAKALGQALRRPAFVRVPGFVLKLIFGEMAEETVLASQKVASRRLQQENFSFQDTDVREILNQCVGSTR